MRGVEALAQEREKWLTRWVLIKLEPVKTLPVEGSDRGGSERTFRLTIRVYSQLGIPRDCLPSCQA